MLGKQECFIIIINLQCREYLIGPLISVSQHPKYVLLLVDNNFPIVRHLHQMFQTF